MNDKWIRRVLIRHGWVASHTSLCAYMQVVLCTSKSHMHVAIDVLMSWMTQRGMNMSKGTWIHKHVAIDVLKSWWHIDLYMCTKRRESVKRCRDWHFSVWHIHVSLCTCAGLILRSLVTYSCLFWHIHVFCDIFSSFFARVLYSRVEVCFCIHKGSFVTYKGPFWHA